MLKTRLTILKTINSTKLTSTELISNGNVHYNGQKATKTNKLFYNIDELPKYFRQNISC